MIKGPLGKSRKSLDLQTSESKSPHLPKSNNKIMRLKVAGEPMSRESAAAVSVGSQAMHNNMGVRVSQRNLNTLNTMNNRKMPSVGASPNSLALAKA